MQQDRYNNNEESCEEISQAELDAHLIEMHLEEEIAFFNESQNYFENEEYDIDF
jgi:hypothetical protein